jgi:hypothetical protein
MSSVELLYFAKYCREMAQSEADPSLKTRLLDMAQDYRSRATRERVAY